MSSNSDKRKYNLHEDIEIAIRARNNGNLDEYNDQLRRIARRITRYENTTDFSSKDYIMKVLQMIQNRN